MKEIDAGEWPSFDEKRLSWQGPGVAFSMLTRLNFSRLPKRAASLTSPLRIDHFVEFRSSIFMRMNHQIDAGEWPSFDQKRLSRCEQGIALSMLTRLSLPQPLKRTALLAHQGN
jgi:hypothetical protein